MKSNNVLKQIKVLLGMEVKLTESKLKDGTLVSFDELAIGSNFLIKKDAETAVPAPAGEYELEDGTIVVVGAENLITEIKLPNAEETPVEETPVEETPVEETQTEEEIPVEEIPVEETPVEETPEQKRLTVLEQKVAMLEEALQLLTGGYSELDTKLSEIASAPGDVPVHLKKQTEQTETSLLEKRLEFLANFKKNK